MFKISPLVVAGLVAAAGTAAADPGFLTLDRQDGQSRFGGEFSYLVLDDAIDATAFRFDFHGQYIAPSGIGFYAALPITYVSGDGDSATGIADVEVGGIFLPRFANPSFQLPLHAGITLPTASDDLEPALANGLGVGARIGDLAQIIPEGVTLRLGASPMFRNNQFFGRLDGGVDINVSNSGDDTVDPLIHLGIGGGFDFGGASITGEFVTIISTDDNVGDDSASTFAVGVRGVAGNLRPYGGIVLPLGDDDFATDVVITAGLEGTLQ